MKIWCGIDWAEHHHDIAVVDEAGTLLVKRRIGDDLDGFGQLIGVLTELAGAQHLEVPVAMETANGLLAASLLDAGYSLFAINPLAVSRYRDRYSPSRAKSDAADAYVLANILRTDPPPTGAYTGCTRDCALASGSGQTASPEPTGSPCAQRATAQPRSSSGAHPHRAAGGAHASASPRRGRDVGTGTGPLAFPRCSGCECGRTGGIDCC